LVPDGLHDGWQNGQQFSTLKKMMKQEEVLSEANKELTQAIISCMMMMMMIITAILKLILNNFRTTKEIKTRRKKLNDGRYKSLQYYIYIYIYWTKTLKADNIKL
jgi:hypothetical protein